MSNKVNVSTEKETEQVKEIFLLDETKLTKAIEAIGELILDDCVLTDPKHILKLVKFKQWLNEFSK